MVYEYFVVARAEVEAIFNQVYDSIDNFIFDEVIFHEDDKILIKKLKDQDYNNLACSEIASIIPKLIKKANYEDGHFLHLRNYLLAEKDKVAGLLNSILLNQAELRWTNPADNINQFVEIFDQ